MIKFDATNKIFSNIAAIFEKRLKEKTDIMLVIDKTMGEFTEKIENGVISAGSHSQLLDACGQSYGASGRLDTRARRICISA